MASQEADETWLDKSESEFNGVINRFLLGSGNHVGMALLNGRSAASTKGLSTISGQACVMPMSQLFGGRADAAHGARIAEHLASLADYQRHAFTALNTAFFEDGAYIYIPRNTVVDQPIEIVYISSGHQEQSMNSPRTLIIADENSQATIIETFVGMAGSSRLTNAVTEIVVKDGAVIDHYKRCEESASAYQIAFISVQLGNKSNFSSHCFTMAGGFVRNEVQATLIGEHAECTLNGLYLADGDHLVDNHTVIDHASANCDSHENYKGILNGRSRGVFNGKIFVRLDAQKTDAKQTNKTLLLSPDARIDTKPQLEILADDVKCTHGATVGQLDPNPDFSICRARGIPESEARNLLTYAFAGDIVQRVKLETLRTVLDQRLLDSLPQS